MDGKLRHLPGGVEEYLKLMDERETATRPDDRRQMRSRSDSPARTKRPQDASAQGVRRREAQQSKSPKGELARCAPSDDCLSTGVESLSSASSLEADGVRPRLSGGEQRTLRKLMQSNERKIETLNVKVDDVRAQMAMANPTDFAALGDFQTQINDLQSQIDALEEEWMEAAEKLGE